MSNPHPPSSFKLKTPKPSEPETNEPDLSDSIPETDLEELTLLFTNISKSLATLKAQIDHRLEPVHSNIEQLGIASKNLSPPVWFAKLFSAFLLLLCVFFSFIFLDGFFHADPSSDLIIGFLQNNPSVNLTIISLLFICFIFFTITLSFLLKSRELIKRQISDQREFFSFQEDFLDQFGKQFAFLQKCKAIINKEPYSFHKGNFFFTEGDNKFNYFINSSFTLSLSLPPLDLVKILSAEATKLQKLLKEKIDYFGKCPYSELRLLLRRRL